MGLSLWIKQNITKAITINEDVKPVYALGSTTPDAVTVTVAPGLPLGEP